MNALFSFASANRFGPYFSSLLRTSGVLSPVLISTSNSLNTSSVCRLKGRILILLQLLSVMIVVLIDDSTCWIDKGIIELFEILNQLLYLYFMVYNTSMPTK